MPEPITPTEYRAFQKAYDFFNAELFSGTLPHVLVTLQRRARSSGYFAPERFAGRTRSNLNITAHELALNPDNFKGHTDRDILATLTHEMVHAWRQTHGKPDCSYHYREWSAKMKEIGLHPSATGEPGGRETGKHMSHYIVSGGPYAQAYQKLQASGFELGWESRPFEKQQKAKRASKTKFTCPECGQNAWAKPDAQLICGAWHEDGEGVRVLASRLMLAEPE
jgi:hypothetical protein